MSWKVEYAKRFLKEMSRLPPKARGRAEKIAFEELGEGNPFELGYVERMKGYPGRYKIRFGQYRMGVEIDSKKKFILCKRVANRKDIYRVFP